MAIGLQTMLEEEEKRLAAIVMKLDAEMETLPDGRLRISKSHNHAQFYRKGPDITSKNGIYLAEQKEHDLIQKLAQRMYDEKVLKVAKKRLWLLRQFLRGYTDEEIADIFSRQNEIRKDLIVPVEPIWQQQLEAWENQTYKGKEFQVGTKEIFSERGERVRSKSEKILADYFFMHQIPYKYEKPLALRGYRDVIYPDFTFLSRKTGKEIYWEHFGKMDDPAYVVNAVRKIALYEKNGYMQGERLLMTFETEVTGFDSREMEVLVRKHLL